MAKFHTSPITRSTFYAKHCGRHMAFFMPTTNSPALPAPTRCPVMQFSSDTGGLEVTWIPQWRTQSHKTAPTSDAVCKSWANRIPDQLAVKLESEGGGSHSPLLGFDNLQEWLTELSSYYYKFIMKDYESGTAKWKECTGQSRGRVYGCVRGKLLLSPASSSQHLHVFVNLEASWTLWFQGGLGLFMEVPLGKHGGLTQSLTPLPSLEVGVGLGLKFLFFF